MCGFMKGILSFLTPVDFATVDKADESVAISLYVFQLSTLICAEQVTSVGKKVWCTVTSQYW